MAKTNFKKVENALEEGLRKMTVGKLCSLADIAAGIGNPSGGGANISKHRQQLIRHLKTDLTRLKKVDSKIYAKLRVKKGELEVKFSTLEKLDETEWQALEDLRAKTKVLVEEYYPKSSDEDLIKKEQAKHHSKRFNVNEKWLPLQ